MDAGPRLPISIQVDTDKDDTGAKLFSKCADYIVFGDLGRL